MWQPPSAPEALKKRMLRTVLHAIILDTTQEPPEHVVPRHWHGGGHTEWHVARQTAGTHGRTTDRDALEVIRALSTGCRALTMAATLNRLGSRTGTGHTWRAHRVACGRYPDRLPHCPKEQDGLTLEQAAQQLGVSATVIKRLMRQGTLPARQGVPLAPGILQHTDLDLAAVQAEGQAVRTGHRRPRRLPGQPVLPVPPSTQRGDDPIPSSPPETLLSHLTSGAP